MGEHGRLTARRGFGRVDLQDHRALLVACLDEQRESGAAPLDRREVGEEVAVPVDGGPGTVEAEQVQRDIGIGRAGGRVADRSGGCGGLCGVGDHPPVDGCFVDPTGGDRGAVGAPPVPAGAPHLLCGDEVGAAPRDPVGLEPLATGERVRPAVEFGDAQARTADVGDPPGGRVWSRIEHRPVHGEFACLPREQAAGEESAAERERDHRDRAIGRIGGDPAGTLASAFAPRPLGGGEVGIGIVGLGEQRARVGDAAFDAGVDVEHPQRVHRVAAAGAAQEHDAATVGGDRDGARLAEREPLRARMLPGEGVGHGSTVGKWPGRRGTVTDAVQAVVTAGRGPSRGPRGCRGR